MSKRAERPQSRRHILVFDEDWEYLDKLYGPQGLKRIGVGPAIRQIIHAKVKALKAREIGMRDSRQASEEEEL